MSILLWELRSFKKITRSEVNVSETETNWLKIKSKGLVDFEAHNEPETRSLDTKSPCICVLSSFFNLVQESTDYEIKLNYISFSNFL